MSLEQFDERTPYLNSQEITGAIGTTGMLVTATDFNVRIDAVTLSNSDAVVHHVRLVCGPIGGMETIGVFALQPAVAPGLSGPVQDGFSQMSSNHQFVVIPPDGQLAILNDDVIPAGKFCAAVAMGGSF